MRTQVKPIMIFSLILAAIASVTTTLNAVEKPVAKKTDQPAVAKSAQVGHANRYAEILVIDRETGRGVPLVELETVNGQQFVTDSAGRVAFYEPDLMDREIFFYVRSHGYSIEKDGFGYEGVRVTPTVGKIAEIKIRRDNIAERLCRLTGEGIYRDSMLLGHKLPRYASENPGRICGQDSVRAVPYNKKIYWVWGDTLQMKYPLGLFRTAGATTEIPNPKDPQSDPANGVELKYFVDEAGFARAMIPIADKPGGVVWILTMFTVKDEQQQEKLVAHYSLRKNLFEEVEQGIAVFNDQKQLFEPVKQLPLNETWRRPSGHPVEIEKDGAKWFLFGSPNPNVRCPATLKSVLDPSSYEAFTCASQNAKIVRSDNKKIPEPDRFSEPWLDATGKPIWRWQKEIAPTDSHAEIEWIKEKKLNPKYARFAPLDSASANDRIELHSGTVRWNEHRKRWVMLAGEANGKRSNLGEVWYAESKEPTGPFSKAVRVVTHKKYSFYNVCHHSFFDRYDGQTIHFEGTYTNMFSGNENRTPRYEYNQVLYRLDLDSEKLKAARAE